MLSNAFKKSLTSVYEPMAYKKLYKLLTSLFNKESEQANFEYELQLSADIDQTGLVIDIY